MPRRPRLLQRGDYYHVLNRASVRARIFFTPADYQAFVDLLSTTVDEFRLPLLAYCVMPNHWHLVVRPESQRHLSKSMHWLTSTHARRWCREHERKGPGPVYQGRFKSIPVEPNWHLLRVCRYVERNARSADLVTRAEDWTWCSANQRLRNRDRPSLVPLQFLTPASWLTFLNESPRDSAVAAAIRRNRPFGGDQWALIRDK